MPDQVPGSLCPTIQVYSTVQLMRRTSTRHGESYWSHKLVSRNVYFRCGSARGAIWIGAILHTVSEVRSDRRSCRSNVGLHLRFSSARAATTPRRVLFPAGIRELRLRRDWGFWTHGFGVKKRYFAGAPLEEREMEQHDSSCQFRNHVVCYGVALLAATAPYKSRPGDGVAYRGVEWWWWWWLKRPQMRG